LALFLDDQDLLQPFGEMANAFRLQGQTMPTLYSRMPISAASGSSMPSSSSAWRTSR
jgi:hypothetical protein